MKLFQCNVKVVGSLEISTQSYKLSQTCSIFCNFLMFSVSLSKQDQEYFMATYKNSSLA